MCDVCCASAVIDAAQKGKSHTFKWSDNKKFKLVVAADAAYLGFGDPEGRNRFRFKAVGGHWSKWIETKDLAGSMLRLGVDVRWPWVRPEVKEWLAGERDIQDVEKLLKAKRLKSSKKAKPPKLVLAPVFAERSYTAQALEELADDLGVSVDKTRKLLNAAAKS
jgi:hypothetical protein